MAVNDSLLQGIAGILQQVTQGLTQSQDGGGGGVSQATQTLQQAAMAASLVAVLAGGLNGGAQGQTQPQQQPPPPPRSSRRHKQPALEWHHQPAQGRPQADLGGAASQGGSLSDPLGAWSTEEAPYRERFTPDMLTEPLPTTLQYLERHGLDGWLGEVLDMMTYEQRVEVMGPPLNMEHAVNPNGVVLSRIKEAVSVEQRIQMFVSINGLAEGVVDRLSTLTPQQQEAVMDSSMKINKAKNPSGVAMRRISDVLKFGAVATSRNSQQHPQQHQQQQQQQQQHSQDFGVAGGAYVSAVQVPPPPPAAQQQQQFTPPHRRAGPSAAPGEDRSRSRPPHGAPAGAGAVELAPDVLDLVRDFESRGLHLDWWVGEVLTRMSLFQRQTIAREVGGAHGLRNPSSFVMSKVRAIADPRELVSIFVDLNGLDRGIADQLWELSPEQQSAVIAPGIYVQNVRNPSTAVRSRIQQVLAGNDAVGPSRRSTSSRNSHPNVDV